MKVLVIIPAYNEQDCIVDTVRTLTKTCPDLDYLVINDGSTDGTESLCRTNGIAHVTLPVNCGLAAGFQTGMKYAERNGYDAAMQFDADGQHLPSYIAPMIAHMEKEGADVVIASRVLAGAGAAGVRGVGARLISWLIRTTTGVTITDPTSGMRLYNRREIHEFAHSFDFAPEPDTIALLARRGDVIVEVPARMRERQGGTSYFDFPAVVRYMARTCLSILMFQWFR